jgi:hypothetical protein
VLQAAATLVLGFLSKMWSGAPIDSDRRGVVRGRQHSSVVEPLTVSRYIAERLGQSYSWEDECVSQCSAAV